MALNIITAKFYDKPCAWTDEQWQWDYGQILQFEGLELPEAYEVHFSNIAIGGESITQIGNADGVTIPDQFFTTGETIYAWIYLHQGDDDGETVYSVTIPVKKRPQPSDTPPTPQEQSAIDQAIAALNVAVEKSETAIEHYPHIQDGTWWVWDVTTETWVDTQVEAQGPKGNKGDDGYSPTVTVTDITDGHRVTITDKTGTHVFDIMDGEKGDTGNGIASIAKTGTVGLVDTYTITYTNGQTTTFTVTNGITPTVDDELSDESENPVQNKVIDAKIGDLKADLSQITTTAYGKNRFNPNGDIIEGYYLGNDGSLVQSAAWNISDYCVVDGFSDVVCWDNSSGNLRTMWFACAYNADKSFKASLGNDSTFSLPSGTAYIRFCDQVFSNTIMVESGTTKTTFEPYMETIAVLTDKTLMRSDRAANSKAVGDRFASMAEQILPFEEKQIVYSPIQLTMTQEKLLNGNTGAITNASGYTNYLVSDYIDISSYKKIMVSTEHFWGQGLYAFYDENKVFVSGLPSAAGGTVTTIYNKLMSVPNGVKYIVIGYLYQASFPEPYLFGSVESSWSSKKWVCFGDSLTANNSRTSLHYFDIISGSTGINVVNKGVSGTGYSTGGTNNFMTLASSVNNDASVVTIFGSGNDSTSGLQLGTAADTGTTTLGGVINTTIDNIRDVLPIVPIGIITPTPWINDTPADNGWMESYVNLIIEICKRRSIMCLDLYHSCGLDPDDPAVLPLAYSKDSGNGVHIDETGHRIIAPKILNMLRQLVY